MYKLLLIGMGNDDFTALVNGLQAHGSVELSQVDCGEDALVQLKDTSVDLAVAAEQLPDMSGLEFAEKLVVQNPMINCALSSSLDEADFHEASEGLGILARLPLKADASQAENLVEKLNVITGKNL